MLNVDEQLRVDFAALEWEQPVPGVRFKAVTRGGQKLRLVEFTNEFNEPDWCRNGHAGYMLAGALEIQFADRSVTFRAGEGFFYFARRSRETSRRRGTWLCHADPG